MEVGNKKVIIWQRFIFDYSNLLLQILFNYQDHFIDNTKISLKYLLQRSLFVQNLLFFQIKILIFNSNFAIRITPKPYFICSLILSDVFVWDLLTFASTWIEAMKRFFWLKRHHLWSLCLRDEVFLNQKSDVLWQGMDVLVDKFLFYEKEFKFLLELLVDIIQFS